MEEFPRKRAFLIGVDEYKRVSPLRYCGNDARSLGKTFRDALRFRPEDVLELTVGSPLKPARDEILHQLGEFLKADVAENDLLLFYFAGHGMMDPDRGRDYLLPLDASPHDLAATGIAVEHIVRKLTATVCKNIVIFIDACRQELQGARALPLVGEFSKKAVERDGLVTFFSCDPKERSYEITDLKHGSFTHCLLEAIEKGEYSTVEAMDRYLRDEVPLVNAKFSMPVQRPFTIVQPTDKLKLAVFYSEKKKQQATNRYENLYDRLANLYASNFLEIKVYSGAADFLERTKDIVELTGVDAAKMKSIVALYEGDLRPGPFCRAWSEYERQLTPSSPPKSLDNIE